MELWSKRLLMGGERKLTYTCYFREQNGYGMYYYAKLPLGEDRTVYYQYEGSSNLANKSSDLTSNSSAKWTSVSETKAVYTGGYSCSRYYEGDLYE